MAIYTAKGIIASKDAVVSGTSASGRDWARQNIMIDIPGYQGAITKLSLTANNERVETVAAFNIGDRVEIGFTIYAREWQGRWYNNVEIVNIKPADQPVEQAPVSARQQRPAAPSNVSHVAPGALEPQDDDLPFM